MGAIILNKKSLAERNVNLKKVNVVEMYKGDSKVNLNDKNCDSIGQIIVKPSTPVYNGSEGEAKVMRDIEIIQRLCKNDLGYKLTAEDRKKFNAAQYPGQTAIEALIGAMYLDITRRAQESGDLTSEFATEANDPNSDQTVNVNWFYKYIGKFGKVTGSNDPINLIEQKLGATDTFTQDIWGLGWRRNCCGCGRRCSWIKL